jgi:hydrogenase-4 component B
VFFSKILTGALIAVAILLVGLGGMAWTQPWTFVLEQPWQFGPFAAAFGADRVASVFLFILGVLAACSAVFSSLYIQHLRDRINEKLYWTMFLLFVLGMAGVVLAADAVSFLIAWEIMSLSSATLVISDYRQHKAQRAGIVYLVATRIATGLLAAGFLIMYANTGSWFFNAWHFNESAVWLPAGLILLGFAIKAGIWPFHIWLPYAHSEAPSPVSALMSGVMIKIPVYGALRLFADGLNCPPLIVVLFSLAAVSSFWGILFAINQRDIKRLLAYSSVENVGLIFLSLSVALWAKNCGFVELSHLALCALLLQCIGHACFKSLLFFGTGAVDYAAHTRELADLGGLIKSMPVTAACFIIGSAAICALPPLIGFVGKWYLYQSLCQAVLSPISPMDRGLFVVLIGVLSIVGALAVACFAKAIGVAFLGKPRSHRCELAYEVPPALLAPQFFLAALCVFFGIAAPVLVPFLNQVFVPSALATPAAIIVPNQLLPMTFAILVLVLLIYTIVLSQRCRRYITWECGFGALSTRAQVAADSFAQPIARIFRPVFRYHLSVEISGRDRRHFPEKIHVEPSMVSLLETRVYEPVGRSVNRLSSVLARLQAGSIHLYLMYLCVSLALLVLLGTNLW